MLCPFLCLMHNSFGPTTGLYFCNFWCGCSRDALKKNFIFSDIVPKCVSGSGWKHHFGSIGNNDILVVCEGVEISLSLLSWPLYWCFWGYFGFKNGFLCCGIWPDFSVSVLNVQFFAQHLQGFVCNFKVINKQCNLAFSTDWYLKKHKRKENHINRRRRGKDHNLCYFLEYSQTVFLQRVIFIVLIEKLNSM